MGRHAGEGFSAEDLREGWQRTERPRRRIKVSGCWGLHLGLLWLSQEVGVGIQAGRTRQTVREHRVGTASPWEPRGSLHSPEETSWPYRMP